MQGWLIQYGEQAQVYLFFGLLLILLGAERLWPRRHPTSPQQQRWGTNAALSVLAILTLPLLPITFISAAWWAESENIGLLNQWGEGWPLWLVLGLTLLLRGFISFATHLLNHKVPILWRIHRVHHLDTELDVSSTVRFHPLEMPLTMIIGLPLVVIFGLSPWALIFYELLDAGVTLFSHSNLRVHPSINRFLRYVIVTPDLHKVHHSTVVGETNSNYSAVFPVWDMVFGTFRTKTAQPLDVMPLGLAEVRGTRANSFWWLIMSPFSTLPTPAQSTVELRP